MGAGHLGARSNAGTTSFGPTNLGAGWDCNPVDLMEPTCHWSILNWNAAGISCWNLIGPYTTPVGDVAFPLAVINLNAIAQGTDHLTLASVLLTSTDAIDMGDIGSCNPVSSAEIPCYGAEIVLIAVGTIGPTPTPALTFPVTGHGPCGSCDTDG